MRDVSAVETAERLPYTIDLELGNSKESTIAIYESSDRMYLSLADLELPTLRYVCKSSIL